MGGKLMGFLFSLYLMIAVVILTRRYWCGRCCCPRQRRRCRPVKVVTILPVRMWFTGETTTTTGNSNKNTQSPKKKKKRNNRQLMLLSNQKSKQNEIGLAKKKKNSVGTGQLFPVNFPRVNKKRKKKEERRGNAHTHIEERG
jgi:hypothetical protein